MNTRAYLKQYRILVRTLEQKKLRIETLESLCGCSSHSMEASGSRYRDVSKSSKVEHLALELMETRELELKIKAEQEKMLYNITAAIHAVNNITYEYILEAYYKDGKTFDQIADEMQLSRDYVYRLHGKAIKLVKIIDNGN